MNFIEKQIQNNIIIDTSNEELTNQEPNQEPNINEQTNKPQLNEIQRQHIKKELLFAFQSKKPPQCGLIVVDNFYNNALETRKYVLTQEFTVRGNFPGQRTRSYATQHLKDIIQGYVEPFSGKITVFPMPTDDDNNADNDTIYNGSFQYTVARDRSWIHTDKWNNWAGVLFLTPNAPLSAGTAFYKFHDGTRSQADTDLLKNQEEISRSTQDFTKWELVDRVGNVFNRLILFNANQYHMSMDYFGDTKENGRLFQVFFFSTER
jgi:hypothetical protein